MEESKRVVVLLVQLLVVCIQCTLAQQGFLSSSTERIALLDLRSSLGIRSREWPIKCDPCSSWKGIQCRNGRVFGINVSGFKQARFRLSNPSFSVDSLPNFTFLETFNASRFALPGSIPYWMGRLGSLRELDLRSSSVSGSIPDSLGNLTRLSALFLGDNQLVGRVPDSVGRLQQLSVLDLSRNSLSGLIPDGFALLTNLSRLDLSENYFTGSIPPGLGNISGLQFFNLSNNSLAGSIPVELGNLSQLRELSLSENSLSGSLPVELKGLRDLSRMDLGDNELEGRLPDSLFSRLDSLKVVVLRGNRFDGALPDAFWSLPNLQALDVSGNNFTGEVNSVGSINHARGSLFNLSNNQFYGTMTSVFRNSTLIDLSGNYVQGKVPDGSPSSVMLEMNCLQDVSNQRSSGDCRWFYDSRGLTFDDDFGFEDPTQPPLTEPTSKKSKSWIYLLVGLLGGVGFVAVLILLTLFVLKRCYKSSANQRGSANVGHVAEGDSSSLPKDYWTTPSTVGEPFTYEQLVNITGRFSETNLIKHGHSGDLFRGLIEGGISVVIKKVDFQFLKTESYLVELKLLRKCSHTRLVPFLGYCLENENEKLLVYKHMPNGDLADSLHKFNVEDDGLQSLDWITRLKIAIGAAEGLAYLHHECNPPLVHRDVQASSILLDNKFEVRLGSLSEVCVQEGDSHHTVLTRFLRKTKSFGSETNTFGSSTTTCSYDVYCFGKVLLELVTGKLGISKSDDACSKEWLENTLACISIYDRELVSKIIDPSLIVDEDLLEEVWAMAIVARSCLNPKPSRRPPMKYVLKALENPFKVVRDDSYSSGRLRTTSSRRSWSAAFLGSWRHSSSDNAKREGFGGLRQTGRVGSHSSGGVDHSSSNKRISCEIFPEPPEMEDTEGQDER